MEELELTRRKLVLSENPHVEILIVVPQGLAVPVGVSGASLPEDLCESVGEFLVAHEHVPHLRVQRDQCPAISKKRPVLIASAVIESAEIRRKDRIPLADCVIIVTAHRWSCPGVPDAPHLGRS